jgi:hypothetical protein
MDDSHQTDESTCVFQEGLTYLLVLILPVPLSTDADDGTTHEFTLFKFEFLSQFSQNFRLLLALID